MSQTVQKYDPVFLESVARVRADEGGHVCNPADPGGETNFGIRTRSYPEVVKNLTRDQTVDIYRNDWWLKFCFYRMRGYVAIKVFNLAVVMGASLAVRRLQRELRACGAGGTEDGEHAIPTTQAAYSWPNTNALLAAITSEAAGYFQMTPAYS